MAWYTDTTNAPKVVLETVERRENISLSTDTGLAGKYRTITNIKSEFRGLTQAAADSIASAKQDSNTNAVSARENNGGAYKVVITDNTIGAWT